MDASIVNETQLIAEIDRLREQFPHTQDLYREVCTLLFFRYGTTPTANKLYQLVRKGSMSAPAEALAKFWSELREKSRTRIEHPDLPDALKSATGEFAAALWTAAQEHAHQNLAGYRQEADATVIDAQASLATARLERDKAMATVESSQATITACQTRVSELEQTLAATSATNASLEKQLAQATADNLTLQEHLESARRDFGAQLDRMRDAVAQAEERFQSAEKRFLLETDRERQASSRLQKELDMSRATISHAGERHRQDTEALLAQIGNLRQQVGSLEGKLHETVESRKALTEEVKELATRSQELASHAVTLQAELHGWRSRAETAEALLKDFHRDKPTKRSAKSSK